ncbi:hypothetical protein ABBQ38_006411 [Trebouxia sp. C0009 RCD-2024]
MHWVLGSSDVQYAKFIAERHAVQSPQGSSAVHDAKLAAQAVCSAKPTGVTAQTSKAVSCLPHSQSSTGARGMHWVLGSSAVRYA